MKVSNTQVDFHDIAVIHEVNVGDDMGASQRIREGANAAHLEDVTVFQGLHPAHVDVHA